MSDLHELYEMMCGPNEIPTSDDAEVPEMPADDSDSDDDGNGDSEEPFEIPSEEETEE